MHSLEKYNETNEKMGQYSHFCHNVIATFVSLQALSNNITLHNYATLTLGKIDFSGSLKTHFCAFKQFFSLLQQHRVKVSNLYLI